MLVATLVRGTELKFVTQEFAPFSYELNGIVSGPAADIIRKVCKEMGIGCSLECYPWPRAQRMVELGSAQGLFVIGWHEERTKYYYFTPPILKTEYGFFVRDDNPLEFKRLSDVAGYSVAVFGPSNTSNSLEKIKDEIKTITIDMTPHDEACFKKLSKGRIMAVYSNRDVGYALIEKLNLKNIRYSGRQKKLKYYIGFSKKHTDKNIVDGFNETLLNLHKKGLIQQILKEYSMEPADSQ